MTDDTSRAVKFAPLRNFDIEATDERPSIDRVGEGDTEAAQKHAAGRQWQIRASSWALCSALSLYTSKRLLVNHGFHYPLTIAFLYFIVLLVLYTIAHYRGPSTSNTSGSNILRLGVRAPDDGWPDSQWVCMIPASIAAAASVPLFMEGLLHMPSLPVIVMLFPTIHVTESMLLFLCCSSSRPQKILPWEAIIATMLSSMVLYNEYRLMVPGLVCGVGGITLIGVARACFTMGSNSSGRDIAVQARLRSYHGFVVMTLIDGLIFSGLNGYYLEPIREISSVSISTVALLLLNIASTIGTSFTGTSMLAYSPVSFENVRREFSNVPIHLPELLVSTIASLLVLFATTISDSLAVISWRQILGYLSAIVCIAGHTQIHALGVMTHNLLRQRILKTGDARTPSKIFTVSGVLLLIVFATGSLSFISSAFINAVPGNRPTSLDLLYTTNNRFDIVVSIYREDKKWLKGMLEEIKATSMLSGLQPQVIVYTKDPEAELYDLKVAIGADTVVRLENLGREGGTYLWHIVNNWDNLAQQTMFIQAHAHNIRELIPRINDYLVPETGMLSLGFTGVLCPCGGCSDRWGWQDKWDVITALYEKIYGEPCAANEPILLSYKGQFVASAKRIRGISRKIYGALLDTITSEEGWSHNLEVVGDGDTPDNPYFGFTVERIWGLLMQCGTDQQVAAKCPSLLSGMQSGGDVSDCQCLDPVS